jgi:O-antigen ligase
MLENKVSANFVAFSLLLNSSVLLIPNKFKGYPILIFFVCALFYYWKAHNKNTYTFKKILLLGAIPIIYLASCLYSFKSNEALFKLQISAVQRNKWKIFFRLLFSRQRYSAL